MTFHRSTLLATASLALVLPSLSIAQEAMTEDAGPALEDSSGTLMTEDSGVAMTGESGEAMTETTTVTTAASDMSLEGWTYDEIYASGISIQEMVGADVYGPDGEDIGDVENVLFDMDGRILSVVAEIGGFLDIGDTHVSIPWDMIASEDWSDGIIIPFGEDEVENYVLAESEVVTLDDVSEIEQVSGDGIGEVQTGAETWAATDLLNDSARLREGDAYSDYGTISDLIVRDGRIEAVLVDAVAGAGTTGGVFGYPYAGRGAGWDRQAGTYDMPYDRGQAGMVQPFDPAMLTD